MIRQLIALVTVIALGMFCSDQQVQSADLVRVGILGIDNYGSIGYTEFLNRPHAAGDRGSTRARACSMVWSPRGW